jgi:hypothetical protein
MLSATLSNQQLTEALSQKAPQGLSENGIAGWYGYQSFLNRKLGNYTETMAQVDSCMRGSFYWLTHVAAE